MKYIWKVRYTRFERTSPYYKGEYQEEEKEEFFLTRDLSLIEVLVGNKKFDSDGIALNSYIKIKEAWYIGEVEENV